jgi:hypothetical protein
MKGVVVMRQGWKEYEAQQESLWGFHSDLRQFSANEETMERLQSGQMRTGDYRHITRQWGR